MKRWHQEAAHARRENIKHLRQVHDWPKKEVDCVCDTQIGRFRKLKGLGCRKRQCTICRYEKIYQIPTIKERIADERFKEQLEYIRTEKI